MTLTKESTGAEIAKALKDLLGEDHPFMTGIVKLVARDERLAAIEAAGDEEVAGILLKSVEDFKSASVLELHDGLVEVACVLANVRQQIAELTRERDEFREAARMVKCDIGSKDLGSYDRIPIFVSSLGKLMEVYEKGGAA